MSMESFIRDVEGLAHNSRTPSDLEAEGSNPLRCVPSSSLAARWYDYDGMASRLPQDIERAEQVREIAQGYQSFTKSGTYKDEIENMQSILTCLNNLAEKRQLYFTDLSDVDQVLSKIRVGTVALNDALFKRQQFMLATKDYSNLPDKIADELIQYLICMRPSGH